MPSILEKKILARLDGIEKSLEELKNKDIFTLPKTSPIISSTELPKTEVIEPPRPNPMEPPVPVPTEYRKIVNEVLNERFGIIIDPDPTRPAFTFKLIVPKEYSNADEGVWRDAKADVRSKVLTYGEGVLGVRTYVELVKANLGPDICAKIEADKQ